MTSTITSEKHIPQAPSHVRPQSIISRNATHFSQRPTDRLLPMRVLCLGLCRTGTVSLRNALFTLGFQDVYHMASLDTAVPDECSAWLTALGAEEVRRRRGALATSISQEQYEAGVYTKGEPGAPVLSRDFWNRMTGHVSSISDVPCALFAQDLLQAYPDAPVILTIRSPAKSEERQPRYLHGANAFATSCSRTILTMRRRVWWMTPGFWSDVFVRIVPVPRQALVRRKTLSVLFGDDIFLRDGEFRQEEETRHAEQIYREHNERILQLCEQLGRRVLVYNVTDGWGPLIKFLNGEAITDTLPTTGTTEEEQASVESADAESGASATTAPTGSDLREGLLEVPEDADGKPLHFPRLNDTASFHKVVGEKARQMKAQTRAKVTRAGSVVVVAAAVTYLLLRYRRGR